jgi:hypothetical protein
MSEDQSLALSKRGIQWDLWSVGVLLYRVCSGYYPFYENDFATLLTSIKHSDATDLHKIVTHLPHPIVAMIEQCLKKEPNERPLSLDPIIEVLQTYFNSRGISDIDKTISVYMNDKLQISPIPNDSTPVPDKKPSSNSLSTRNNESEWEFSEYKTIHFIPEPSTIQPSAEQQIPLLATEQDTNLTDQTAHNEGIQTKVLYSRFARPAIVVTTIAILVITSILLIKKHSDNLDFSSSSTDTNIENSNGSHTKSNLVVADSIIMPDQNSAVATSQVTETALPDLLTKIDSSSALSITTNDSQTTRQLTTPPITVKQKKTTKPAGLTGILKVIINPLEANVFIDDTLLTQKDMENGRPVSSGDHNITAKAAGYQKSERQILIESNKTLILELELKSEALGNGQLHIYSYPWANLYIDGALIGTTPTPSPISLVEGSHRIVLKRDGFHPYNEFAIIKNGEVTRLQIQLEKAVEKEE